MEDKDKSDGWDDDLEEADELVCGHNDPVSTSFLSSGLSRNVKTENLHILGHEITSGLPSTKASQIMMAERLENIEEESEDLTPEFPLPTKKANTSISELLEDLQARSGSYVKKQSTVCVFLELHQHMGAKDWKPKLPTFEEKPLANMGERSIDSEDPREHIIDGTSSEEESWLSWKDATDYADGKYRHAEFLRQLNIEQELLQLMLAGDSKGLTVQIMSRSLEGKLTVCHCLFEEKSNVCPPSSKNSYLFYLFGLTAVVFFLK
ncbi:hypothetical protein HU200_012395 [Digitaria exilis]|uniref:Uncharacterized protein n=1 Tax=Digitaria exilis TaxID=1010633 RepID=A0A835FEK5_9POAL|nr:hypothetical protein HU200_012395 [Digitaria exilis]